MMHMLNILKQYLCAKIVYVHLHKMHLNKLMSKQLTDALELFNTV